MHLPNVPLLAPGCVLARFRISISAVATKFLATKFIRMVGNEESFAEIMDKGRWKFLQTATSFISELTHIVITVKNNSIF